MQRYEGPRQLVDEIQTLYTLFDRELDGIPDAHKHVRADGVDKTPYEMLAYLLGWLELVMGWEADERAGREVVTPSPAYKWNQLGMLYRDFYRQYSPLGLDELRLRLRTTLATWCEWILTLPDEVFFTPGSRKWSVTNAHWPVWKWLHINSVAPLRTMRSQLRKWKRTIAKDMPNHSAQTENA